MSKQNKHALVVLSGGQDSVTCLGAALQAFQDVSAIHFQYRQKHVLAEEDCVRSICSRYNIPFKIVDMGPLLADLVSSALTNSGPVREVGQPHAHKPGLPSSFVPGRNALFLTLAHAYAQEIGANVLVTGVCQTDYSGYPDCRLKFITALELALNEGYETDIAILTPLMHLNKAQTFALAKDVGFLQEVINNSHTCYNGNHEKEYSWGFGCGECPACLLRRDGYAHYISGNYPQPLNLLTK